MNRTLKDLMDGDRVDGQFLVASCNRCLSNNGKPYLNIVLQDASGTMPAKKWDVEPDDEDICQAGKVISVTGEVLEYKGSPQMKVSYIRDLDQSLVDANRFAIPCPVSPQELVLKLDNYLSSIKDPDLSKLVNSLIKDHREDFIRHPAAVRNHHNCISGLLFHSICMANLAEEVAKLYPVLDRDMLIAGCLVHDLGKTVELSGPIATKYTLPGRLLGHIAIGAALVAEKAKELGLGKNEKALLLEHMVLSHHGEPDKGSSVRPETREALVLHFIDDLDAKMDILDKALDGVNPGDWTQKVFALEEGYFYKPKGN